MSTRIFSASRLCKPRFKPSFSVRALTNANGAPKVVTDSKNTNNNQSMNDTPTPLPEFPIGNLNGESQYDWSKSYFGLSTQAFPKDVADVLLAPLDAMDIEIKPGTLRLTFRDT